MLKSSWSSITEFREAEDFLEDVNGGATCRVSSNKSIAWADLDDSCDEDGNKKCAQEIRHIYSLSYSERHSGGASASVDSICQGSRVTHPATHVSSSDAQVGVPELPGWMCGGVSGRHRHIHAALLDRARRLQAHGFASYKSDPQSDLASGRITCDETEMLRCQTYRPRGCNVWLKRNCLKTVA